MDAQINPDIEIVILPLERNIYFPNNETLPVLIYKQIFKDEVLDPAQLIEDVLRRNHWEGMWRNGIYDYHHYHSTAHEALFVYSGWAEVQLGGPGNGPVHIEAGDLILLPAGTAHKRLSSGEDFAVVGAYPKHQKWDMNYGKEEEYEQAKANIANVPLPQNDPVFGENGKLFSFWNFSGQ